MLFQLVLTKFFKSELFSCLANNKLACKQALLGALVAGQEKEGSLQLCLWNLKICIEKVDAKCRLAEMTLV